jgi:tetratricopeptide (TPR) repeat protein
LANQPQHPQALAYLGDAEMHAGNEKEVEEHLRRALKLDPNFRLAHLDLGILLAGKNDPLGAERHFREAIRIDPSKPDAHYHLGRLLRSLGRKQEADSEFAKVKELAKEEPQEPLINVPGRRSEPAP